MKDDWKLTDIKDVLIGDRDIPFDFVLDNLNQKEYQKEYLKWFYNENKGVNNGL